MFVDRNERIPLDRARIAGAQLGGASWKSRGQACVIAPLGPSTNLLAALPDQTTTFFLPVNTLFS